MDGTHLLQVAGFLGGGKKDRRTSLADGLEDGDSVLEKTDVEHRKREGEVAVMTGAVLELASRTGRGG